MQTLPDEVLVQIAEHLAFTPGASMKESTYALCSLSLCSRRFHRICRSILYRSIPVYTNRAILCLTRTVLHRRDIWEEVRHLEIMVSEDHRSTCLTKHLEDQFKTVLQQLCVSQRASKGWLEHLHSNREGASVALLLVLLPKLTSLGMYFLSPPTYVTDVMWFAALQPVRGLDISLPRSAFSAGSGHHRIDFLTRLSTLRLETDYCTEISFPPILHLPSMRTLSADFFGPSRCPWDVDAGVSGVQNLELTRCELDEDEVLPLLQACRALRKFTFHWHHSWSDEDVMDHEIDDDWDDGINVAPWIIKGLQGSKNTLEVLKLTGQTPIRHDTMSLGSLAAFPRLHSLCVPAVMVLNPDDMSPPRRTLHCLPSSLKNLNLIVAGVPEEGTLESELLECLRPKKWSPDIESLTLTWQQQWQQQCQRQYHSNDAPSFKYLETACLDHGVVFTFETLQ